MASKEKKYLKNLAHAVVQAINLIDDVMKQPSTKKRGRCIAQITNSLEMTNDTAMHFGLGYGFGKIKNLKKS